MTHTVVDNPTKADILRHDGITSVSEGLENGQRVLIIGVLPGSGYTEADFPPTIQGLPVVVRERTISLTPLIARQQSHREMVRPVQSGVSTSNVLGEGTGTLSLNMIDGNGNPQITSNQHVFGSGPIDMGVIQPGIGDISGLDMEHRIGEYRDFIPIEQGMRADFAWGPSETELLPQVFGVGPVEGVRSPELGDPIVKSGRTTGVTAGKVLEVGMTVETAPDEPIMHDQIAASSFADAGDSGSPVMHDDGSGDAAGVMWGAAYDRDGNFIDMLFSDIVNVEADSGLSVMTTSNTGNPPPDDGNGQTGKTLTITNDSTTGTDYEIVIDGEITHIGRLELGENDTIDTSGQYPVLSGAIIGGGVDEFTYEGCVREFSWSGATPFLTFNGDPLPREDVVECPPQDGGNGGDGGTGGGGNGGGTPQEPSNGVMSAVIGLALAVLISRSR